MLYVPVNNFSVMSGQLPQVSCVEQVPLVSHAQGRSTVHPVCLKLATPLLNFFMVYVIWDVYISPTQPSIIMILWEGCGITVQYPAKILRWIWTQLRKNNVFPKILEICIRKIVSLLARFWPTCNYPLTLKSAKKKMHLKMSSAEVVCCK